jgi:hypothetical protein
VSFGFGGQDYIAISIETRKERTEDYSSIKGFFKQRSHINTRAQTAGDAPDFSQRIRTGLPRPPPVSR